MKVYIVEVDLLLDSIWSTKDKAVEFAIASLADESFVQVWEMDVDAPDNKGVLLYEDVTMDDEQEDS